MFNIVLSLHLLIHIEAQTNPSIIGGGSQYILLSTNHLKVINFFPTICQLVKHFLYWKNFIRLMIQYYRHNKQQFCDTNQIEHKGIILEHFFCSRIITKMNFPLLNSSLPT